MTAFSVAASADLKTLTRLNLTNDRGYKGQKKKEEENQSKPNSTTTTEINNQPQDKTKKPKQDPNPPKKPSTPPPPKDNVHQNPSKPKNALKQLST